MKSANKVFGFIPTMTNIEFLSWATKHNGNLRKMSGDYQVSRQAIEQYAKRNPGFSPALKAVRTAARAALAAAKLEDELLTRTVEAIEAAYDGARCPRNTLFPREYWDLCGEIFVEIAKPELEACRVGKEFSSAIASEYIEKLYADYMRNGDRDGQPIMLSPLDLVIQLLGNFDTTRLLVFWQSCHASTRFGRRSGEKGSFDLSRVDHSKSKSLLNAAMQDPNKNRGEAQHRFQKCKGKAMKSAMADHQRAKQSAAATEELIQRAVDDIGQREWQVLIAQPAAKQCAPLWVAAIVANRPYRCKYPISEYHLVPADEQGRIVLQHRSAATNEVEIAADLQASIQANRRHKYALLRENPRLAQLELAASLGVWLLYHRHFVKHDATCRADRSILDGVRDTMLVLTLYPEKIPPQLESVLTQFLAIDEAPLHVTDDTSALTGLMCGGRWIDMPLPIRIVTSTIADTIPKDFVDPLVEHRTKVSDIRAKAIARIDEKFAVLMSALAA